MKEYKVWITIEEYDHEEDGYRDLDEPVDIAIFDTEEEAREFIDKLGAFMGVLHG